jgi:translation initiation factor 2D
MALTGCHRKGPLQPVSMSVKTRQGRKTVTLISGLETFGVDIDDFAEELRKLCAGSTSSELSGRSLF